MELKNPLILTMKFWRSVGALVIREVRKATKAGLFQNNLSKLAYKSREYAKYKANQMRRFTGSGQRLKAFQGSKIASTNTQYVDMTLTGKTMEGFHVKSVDNQSVTMAYNAMDREKIIGNRKHGYDIVGLNDKNVRLVKNEIIKAIGLNVREHQKIVINVSI